ncbi:MAG: helix-turn-helix domain-containing protein, partial [Lactobacillus crispatus]|nr:helix-turn-helix domain-containing protein [Lactobacillus crispatus]
MIKTQVVELRPNKIMQRELERLCNYRRYCWNLALATWQDMYEAWTCLLYTSDAADELRRV